MLFNEGELGKTYTVSRIRGRKATSALAQRSIAVGSDLTILSCAEKDGARVRLINGREEVLNPEEAASLTLEEIRLRKNSDIVSLGGCCAYGRSAEVWDKYLNDEAPGGD